SRLDAGLRCAAALVGNYLHTKAGRPKSTLERHVINPVMGRAVMREENLRLAPTALAQPVDMHAKALPDRLIIVEHPHLATDKLANPHRERIAAGARAAQIAIRPHRHQRVTCDPANAALLARIRQKFGVVSTSMGDRVLALPDMGILLRPLRLILAADLVEGARKPSVVAPVQFDNLAVFRRVDAKALVGGRGSAFGVPSHPDFRVLLAHRRDRLLPRHLTDRLGLVDPQKAYPGGRFDALDVSSKADKGEIDPAVSRSYEFLADLVISGQPRLGLDRLLDLRHAAFVEAVLELPAADNNPRLLRQGAAQPVHRRHLCEGSRFGTAAAAVCAAVQRLAAEHRDQFLRQFDPTRGHAVSTPSHQHRYCR